MVRKEICDYGNLTAMDLAFMILCLNKLYRNPCSCE